MPTASFLAVVLICAAASSLSYADRPAEILALQHFRSSLADSLGALSGWNASSPSAPCDWPGISCYQNSVRELRLPRLGLEGRLTDRLADLPQLRKLSLHSNSLSGSIPGSLSRCVLLRAVYLHNNSFSGELPTGIFNLTNLQILNVAGNFLSGTIAGDLPARLRYLDLSYNSFSGKLPANFSFSSGLELINLSFNRFSSEVPGSIGNLQSLEYLWLDSNSLYGTLPSAISNCSALVHVSAGGNSLQGLIPTTIGLLPNLQVLSLPNNQISDSVPWSILGNAAINTSSLRIVQLGFNALTGIGIPNSPSLPYSGNLQVLDLHGNYINDVFPNYITKISTLVVLDISRNSFTGILPDEIGNLVNLEELRVANNLLTGEVPVEIRKCGSLKVLDLGGNQFSGLILDSLSDLKNLKTLSLVRNRFSGFIPSSLGTLSDLETLDLSDNNLSGAIPDEVFGLSNLSTLNLGNNKFSGEIQSSIGNVKGLRVLNMSGCGFSGKIPVTIGSLLRLTNLDLSKQNLSGDLPFELFGLPNLQIVALEQNNLSGLVPEGFSSLSGLQLLNLSSNSFSGTIPSNYGFLQSMGVISLSDNDIIGSIPEELGNCSSLEVLELRDNDLTGHIPGSLFHLKHLQRLDLGENSLTGTIPDSVSNCSSLVSLSLDSNQLSGLIPDSLPKLLNLTKLDLSSNRLSGDIPSSLGLIRSLSELNLSRNNLEGEIPEILASKFGDPSVFVMNENLCGRPLRKNCKKKDNKRRLIILIGVAVGGSLIVGLLCCGYLVAFLYWHKKVREGKNGEKKPSPARTSSGLGRGENGGPYLVMFNNKIAYAETVEATRQFDEENVLSRGKYGLLFKATYADGMVLSIRRLPDASIHASTFRKEAESLGKIKHRNLTVLRGYFVGPPDIRLLVYDYMPNGNLATLLQEASHQDGHVLNWPMRHLIALGIARGLAFLHSVSIVHGDVKPQNVLFDADFEAHLSEFGLEKLIVVGTEATTSTLVGTLGYVSPEVSLTGQATTGGDVYSFGIVLLEILTGRKPVMFTQDEDIVKWVKRQLQSGQIAELLEPNLLELDPESSEWEEFLLGVKVGLLCTMPDPLERPSMTDVVFMLEGCRVGPENPSSTDPTTIISPT